MRKNPVFGAVVAQTLPLLTLLVDSHPESLNIIQLCRAACLMGTASLVALASKFWDVQLPADVVVPSSELTSLGGLGRLVCGASRLARAPAPTTLQAAGS